MLNLFLVGILCDSEPSLQSTSLVSNKQRIPERQIDEATCFIKPLDFDTEPELKTQLPNRIHVTGIGISIY